MSAVFVIVMILGVVANVVGALCVIVPCLAWLAFLAGTFNPK